MSTARFIISSYFLPIALKYSVLYWIVSTANSKCAYSKQQMRLKKVYSIFLHHRVKLRRLRYTRPSPFSLLYLCFFIHPFDSRVSSLAM
jgi:hypothetical protein